MTEDTTRRADETTANRAMKEVDHTHPDTGRPFGEQVVFARGPAVAADGGERSGSPGNERDASSDEDDESAEVEAEDARMKDVDHEPPNDDDPNRVFERGREGRDEDR